MHYQPTSETLSIIQRLGGIWSGRHAMVCCPVHEDRIPSLSIRQGRYSILVHCFAGCDGADVMRALRQVLGRSIPAQRAVPEVANDRAPPFRHLWDKALPIEGTLGERYLREVRGIGFIPPDVRFLARCPMGRGRAARFLPALLVGVFRRTHLIAIQRLFLDSETATRTDRMMLGNSRGGTWPARYNGPTMRIAEGFESACAFWQITGRDAGTCFGVRNFARFEPAEGTTSITLLPDNDAEGHAFAQQCVERQGDRGIPVSITLCPMEHGDWADIIRPHVHMSIAS